MTERESGQGEGLVIIYKAPDELTANVIKNLLAGEGIPVVLESRMVPWMDGVLIMGEGYWGDVVVPEEYAERSRELIDAYLSSSADSDIDGCDGAPHNDEEV